MAKQTIGNYSYSKSAKTITFTDFSTIRLDRILVIVDATINTILYNFADTAVSGTVATNVLTLSAVPAGSADADKLVIIYDALTADPTYDRVKVDGSAVTQPVSATSLPLPTGAATLAKQPALGTAGSASADVLSVQGIASGTAQPVSAASLPLPSGAATLAKQPALGTAGTASADVITVQGIASGTVMPVSDGGGNLSVDDGGGSLTVDGTVAVSGTVTVDSELTTGDVDTGAGTDTRAVVGLVGAKSGGGALIPGDATKGLAVDLTATGANATAIKVDGSAVTQPVSNASLPLPSGASTAAKQPTVYTEDAAAASDPEGYMLLARRRDTLSVSEVSTDGDNVALVTTNKGQLHVKLADTVTVDASGTAVPVTDNSGSLTVDAPVGTPAFVRLSDGSAAITTLPVSVASVPSHAVTNAGTFAVQAAEADGANVTVGAKADAKSTATDTTPITLVSVLKQISYQLQLNGTGVINKHISASGTLTAGGTTVQTLTQSGLTAIEVEITNVDGAAAIYGTLDSTTPSATNFAFVLPATPSSVTLPMYNTSPTIKLFSSSTPKWAATLRGA